MHKKLRTYGLLRLTLKLMAVLILNCVGAAAAPQWYFELESDTKINKVKLSTGYTSKEFYEPVLYGPDKQPIAFTHHPSEYISNHRGKIKAEPNSIQYVTPGRWIATFKLSDSYCFPENKQDITLWIPRGEIPDVKDHLLSSYSNEVLCTFKIDEANIKKLEAGEWRELTHTDTGLKIKVWGPKCKLPPVQSLKRITMTPPSTCCCSIL